MTTIYLSGPITGTTDFQERFKEAADYIRKLFPSSRILNPVEFCADIPEGSAWEVYMDRCIEVLTAQSTHIHMMPGWRDSKGACCEYYAAKARGLGMV